MSSTTVSDTDTEPSPVDPLPPDEHGKHQLGEFAATAICGNDITSSCLYVSALAIAVAGKLAPIALLMVAVLLFLFRKIYAEVVGALPLNGGAYNALLNTTSKSRASVAACLTILSYMATAVISATEAIHYASIIFGGLHPIWWTTGLLAVFMTLTILGISESSRVAIGIFVFHLTTLSLLLIAGLCFVFFTSGGKDIWSANWKAELTEQNRDEYVIVEEDANYDEVIADATLEVHFATDSKTKDSHDHGHERKIYGTKKASWLTAIFLGFAVALLGISGFESSANFVEEQAPGVFPKTLRNMWIAVSFFNPAMAFLAIALINVSEMQRDSQYELQLLARMGEIAGSTYFGRFLSYMISIDAVMVLSGAVLTSFIGVNGLVRRMTLDRCLPQFLLKTNRRGTTYRILISFFLMCFSVLWITQAEITKLAGVYTLSFLTVMALFAVGNVLLKVKRSSLPRPSRASWVAVIIAIVGVLVGLAGNVVKDPGYLVIFLNYFIPTMLVVALMLYRIPIMKIILSVVRAVAASLVTPLNNTARFVRRKIEEINSQQVVFFTLAATTSRI